RGQHRQRVAQRLARGGGGGDDQVLAAPGRLPCVRLVAVEPRDSARAQGGGQRRRDVRGQLRIVAVGPGNGEAAGDPVGVAPLQPQGQQSAIGRGTVGGG